MHNQQLFNPGYNDYATDLGGTAFYRNQWPGMEGGPVSQIVNIFYNMGDYHTFNLNFLNDKITVFNHMEIGGGYSYRLYLGQHTKWTFGVKASYNMHSAQYGGLNYFDGGDPALSGGEQVNLWNFGAGSFIQSKYWFAGLAAGNLFGNIPPPGQAWSLQQQHFTVTGGWKALDEREYTIYPTGIMKFTKGAPIHVGIDINALLRNQIWLSGGYRIDNTAILSVGYIFINKIKVVYSYDLPVTGRNFGLGGAHEISVGYGMSLFQNGFTRKKYLNRRGGFLKSFQRKGKDNGPEDKPGQDKG